MLSLYLDRSRDKLATERRRRRKLCCSTFFWCQLQVRKTEFKARLARREGGDGISEETAHWNLLLQAQARFGNVWLADPPLTYSWTPAMSITSWVMLSGMKILGQRDCHVGRTASVYIPVMLAKDRTEVQYKMVNEEVGLKSSLTPLAVRDIDSRRSRKPDLICRRGCGRTGDTRNVCPLNGK
ncbi:hypothetical protein RRG08_040583 [Elysia crispata]|uniref:Uncharacterized protein n=1 Tax=Elysia crispata TaxID=231223 RepID=A0AAE0Z9W1_9GAST|nr:hypothetical protein RRG08_040583 [Elysia crispata]